MHLVNKQKDLRYLVLYPEGEKKSKLSAFCLK